MKRILVLDDHLEVRVVLRTLLEDAGYRVGDAPDATHLAELVEDFEPDLVIADICMPGTSGLEAIKWLKGARPDTKVIAISGLQRFAPVGQETVFDLFLDNAVKFGADMTFAKPFEPSHLLQGVDDLLNPMADGAVAR